MNNSSLSRRLKRLEAKIAPPDDESTLRIVVHRVGQDAPDKIIELRTTEPIDWRRPWQRRGGLER